MSDDTCNYETAEGTPCQHPTTDDGDPGRCWIDAHNDAPTDSGDPGRDFSISKSDHEDILQAARDGMSKAGCARAAGVSDSELQRYLDAHPDFRGAFMRARHEGERKLVRGALWNDDAERREMDGQHARFLLSTSFEYIKTEKREVEQDIDGDLTIDFKNVDT